MIEFHVKCYGNVWRRKGIRRAYIRVIKHKYEGVRTRVKTLGGDTEDFPIEI